MQDTPFVTVMMPVYNYGRYVPGAIDSILGQTYPNMGVVIVDDCSTDDTLGIIDAKVFKDREYQEHKTPDYKMKMTKIGDRAVGVIALNRNGGPSRARNIAIEATLDQTDFYANLDADDEMHPHKVEVCVTYMMQSPEIGVVYADYDIFNEATGNVLREYKEPFSQERLLQECIVHSGAVIRKEALVAVRDQFGFYDNEMRTCEDYDLWIRISEKFMICHIAQALTFVRIQPDNSTFTVDKSIWERNWQRIAMKTQARHAQQ